MNKTKAATAVREDQGADCIFCQIVRGQSPVSIAYEDDIVLVFPTLAPVNEGHMLVIPKRHVEYLAQLDDETAAHIMLVGKKVAVALGKSKYRCEGINLFVADGQAAGQEVLHFHLHVYPRFEADGFGFKYDLKRHFVKASRKKLDAVAKEVQERLK
jgi:histidine triad (HIT) family protein